MTTLVEEAAWLSYPEAQRFSGLGRTKLWELISAGDVKAAKVGRAVDGASTSTWSAALTPSPRGKQTGRPDSDPQIRGERI